MNMTLATDLNGRAIATVSHADATHHDQPHYHTAADTTAARVPRSSINPDAYQETIKVLQLKMEKMEELMELKDGKIAELTRTLSSV